MPVPPYRSRLRQPPSSVTGDLYLWLQEVTKAVNSVPQLSYFSGTNPNSLVTGLSGDIAINLGSASTDTRVWVLGGSNLGVLTTQGWVALRTNA